MSLYNDINWKIDNPFNFNKAKLAKVRGNVRINLPATANKIANIIKLTIIKNLRLLDIFLDEILLITLNSK